MPKENELTLVNTVSDVDKIRIVTEAGLSQSIEVDKLKSSLSVDDLPGRVSILEARSDDQESNHIDISSEVAMLKSAVGEEIVDGATVTYSGLFEKINEVRSDLSTFHLEEVNRLDGELNGIRANLTSINGTNGQLEILTDRQTDLESAVNTKLDQSAFQSAVAAGFKVIQNTPLGANASGEPGEVCWDDAYFYVCIATDTWKRTPLESW